MNYIFSKRKPKIGDRGFVIGNRFVKTAVSNYKRMPEEGLVFYAPLFSENESVLFSNVGISKEGNVTYQKFNGIPCGYFNGSSDIHQNSFDSRLAIGYSDRSVSGWMYAQENGWRWILGYGSPGPSARGGEILGINSDGYPVYSQAPDVLDSSTNGRNKWLHLCGVVQNKVRKIYVNGVYKNSDTMTRETDGTYGVYIGSTCGVEYFIGYLSSVRIYNRALTDKEIEVLSKEYVIN